MPAPPRLLGFCYQCPWPLSRPLSIHTSARDSQTLTGKSGSVFYGVNAPFSWVLVCTRFCFCPSRTSFPPVLWKYCNQILLTFKVTFSGDSQPLCWIPRLGSLLWGLEILQQCEIFFGVIVLQFVDHPPDGSMVGLMVTSSRGTCTTTCASQECCWQSPCPCGRPSDAWFHRPLWNTQRLIGLIFLWGSLLLSLGPGAHKVLFVPSKSLWQVWGLIITWLCPSYHLDAASPLSLDVGYLFQWVPTSSCRWLFSS